MQTLEAIFSRRSIRAFLTDPVSDQQMETIIQAAAAAPSGGNAQMRLFIAVRDPPRLAALRALAPGVIGLPPAVIVLCLDLRRQPGALSDRQLAMLHFEIGAALQNVLLAAHDAGLGACAVGSFHPAGLAAFLDLPEGVQPCMLVVLGVPQSIPPAPASNPLPRQVPKTRITFRNATRPAMEMDELKSQLFHLLAYMVASASGLYQEPPDYGSFRLIDASGRLLAIMQSAGWLDPFLARLKDEIDAERAANMDEARQRQRIESWVLEFAHEMRQRLDAA